MHPSGGSFKIPRASGSASIAGIFYARFLMLINSYFFDFIHEKSFPFVFVAIIKPFDYSIA